MLGALRGPDNAGPRDPEKRQRGGQPPRSAASVKRDQTAVLSSRKSAICCSVGIVGTSRSRNVILALS